MSLLNEMFKIDAYGIIERYWGDYMSRKIELYLHEHQRNNFKKDITNIKELFFERIYPTFLNAEQEAERYQDTLWNDLMEQPCGEDDIIDPSVIVESIQEEGFDKYEILYLMHYRTIGMWIACMCQVWEQQLYAFIIQEERINHIRYADSDKKKGFQFAKDVFEYHNQPFESMQCWGKLKELRLLVNVIKHAEGDAEQRLRKIRPDYFTYDGGIGEIDLLKLYHSTLLEPTIQIKGQDFIDYYNAIISFWDELPERMISTQEI